LRDILTGLAILVILALTAALVGPHIVEWTSYRAQIEQRLTHVLGLPLRSDGAISITLLPTPTLSLEDVSIGDETTSHMRVQGFDGTLNLMALLRGEFRINGALRQPDVTLVARPDGSIAGLPAAGGTVAPEKVIIERLLIENATVRLLHAGDQPLVASHVYADAEAATLRGPFKGRMRFNLGDGRQNLSFATGGYDKGRLRVKALLEDEVRATRADIDGTFTPAGDADDRGRLFAGQIGASGNLALPRPQGFTQVIWQMKSPVAASFDAIRLDALDLTLGGGDGVQTTLSGSSVLTLAAEPSLALTLKGKQIDLDRVYASDPANPQPQQPAEVVRRVWTMLMAAAAPAGVTAPAPFALPTRFDVSLDSVIVGGESVDGAVLQGSVENGSVRIDRLAATLPGKAEAALTGGIASGASPRFDGNVRLAARDARRAIAWYTGVADVPLRNIEGTLQVATAGSGVTVRTDGVTLDGGRVVGRIERRLRPENATPLLTAQLSGDGLPLEMAQLLQAGSDQADLDLSLDLSNIRVGPTAAGRVRAHVTRSRAGITLDDVEVTNLAGLSIKGRSSLGQVGGGLFADVKASDIGGLVELARRFGYPDLAAALAARAGSIGGLSGTLRGDSRLEDGRFVSTLAITAAAGATRLESSLRWNQSRATALPTLTSAIAAQASLKSTDSAELLAQLGLDTLPLDSGPANLDISASGQLARTFSVSVNGRVAETQVRLDTRVTPGAEKIVDGRLSLETADMRVPWSTLGFAFPPVPPDLPARIETLIGFAGGKLTFAGLHGSAGGNAFFGELSTDFLSGGRIAGELTFDRVDGPTLAAIALGQPAALFENGGWSVRRFGPPQPPPLYGDVWIETPRLSLGSGLEPARAAFVYRFENGFVSFERAAVTTPWGGLAGALGLRRNGAVVTAQVRLGSGGLKLPGGTLGTLSGELSAAGFGESPQALVRSLAGGGTLKQTGAAIAALDPDALARTLAAFTAPDVRPDPEAVHDRFEAELQAGGLKLPDGDVTVTLAQGILRSGAAAIESPHGGIDASLAVDLSKLQIDGRAEFSENAAPKDWSGRLPGASVAWTGPLAAPRRTLDTTVLSNGLAAIAIARDLDRIQLIEQDARERAFFLRRQRASDDEKRRIEEEKRKAEEAVRAAAEAAREAQRAASRPLPPEPDAVPLPPVTPVPVAPAPRVVPLSPPLSLTPPAPLAPPLDLTAPKAP